MKIFFTGATGVLGRTAIPRLVADDHDVAAVARSAADREWLDGVGATASQVDLFDAESIDRAVAGADAVIHFATAIPPMEKMAKRQAWATNDRLRAEATGLLVDAALAHGVGRFIQQSITLPYADGGEDWLGEDSPLDPAWVVLRSALDAEGHVDRFRRGGGVGVTLRLSRLTGPVAPPATTSKGSGLARAHRREWRQLRVQHPRRGRRRRSLRRAHRTGWGVQRDR